MDSPGIVRTFTKRPARKSTFLPNKRRVPKKMQGRSSVPDSRTRWAAGRAKFVEKCTYRAPVSEQKAQLAPRLR